MMSWLSFFRKDPTKSRAEELYLSLLEQARQPHFYQEIGIPDSVDGRFEMIVLHSYLVIRRLKELGNEGQKLAQSLFDTVFSNFDASLREMGVGDLIVGKRIKGMATAYYGRVEAYDGPMLSDDRALLSEALHRNAFRGEGDLEDGPCTLSDYMIETFSLLSAQSLEQFQKGKVGFPEVPIAKKSKEEPAS